MGKEAESTVEQHIKVLQTFANGAKVIAKATSQLPTISRQAQGGELFSFGDSLNSGDLLALMNNGQGQAAINAASIGEHGASATLPVVASFFCAGQPEIFAQ